MGETEYKKRFFGHDASRHKRQITVSDCGHGNNGTPEFARSFLPERTAVSDLEIEMIMVSTVRIELRATSLTARFARHVFVDR